MDPAIHHRPLRLTRAVISKATSMAIEHTVKAYDEELNNLRQATARMGSLAEAQLQTAMQALVRHDEEMAKLAVQSDSQIDDLERQVSALAMRVLALRQPM